MINVVTLVAWWREINGQLLV